MIKQTGMERRIRWILLLLALFAGTHRSRAEEGMWIPMLIEKYKIDELRAEGLRLTAGDIYSINRDCLKDAVVIFGRGCTGEMVSPEGLVLTNHHCGEGVVQSLSSVEKDYLTSGFWAMSREEEMPAENLSVTFLRSMKEVTAEVTEGIPQGTEPEERERMLEQNMGRIMKEATDGTRYDAAVRPFFYGNAYYLFLYEVFRDVRLVGTPPVSIGNFGGDRDNWIWPRHTGDFMVFRVYADANNEPAEYSPDNRPYRPRRHLEIAAGGVKPGDFTMILGYPGSTSRYLYSKEVELLLEKSLPTRISLRTSRLEIMDRYMGASDTVRIQYATKYRGVSNSWKKWQGMILGLNRMEAVSLKQESEREFARWMKEDDLRQMKYDGIMDTFESLYAGFEPYTTAVELMDEAVMAVELFRQVDRLSEMMRMGTDDGTIASRMDRFYRDFHLPVDREIFAAMMEAYRENMPVSMQPGFFSEIDSKHRGDFTDFAEKLYGRTILRSREKVLDLLDTYRRNPRKAITKLEKDPLSRYRAQFLELYRLRIYPEFRRMDDELERNYQKYMAALIEMAGDRRLSPDANFTMRLTHGRVEGYRPWDAVRNMHATTLSGVMEKSALELEDYSVPARLKELYREKDFGRYGVDGTMPVCFIASNHTSGGNSGSPVLDADGRLVGINFDRNWEGTMSDILYDRSLCRNIAVDIRYVLFIIDKFAGADYLLDEMDISW